jgi:hypothetical protein
MDRARRALRQAWYVPGLGLVADLRSPLHECAHGIYRYDPRREPCCDEFDLIAEIPGLAEAARAEAARKNVAYLTTATDRFGRGMVVLRGATPEQIEAFRSWADAEGLTDVLTDPIRGTASGLY